MTAPATPKTRAEIGDVHPEPRPRRGVLIAFILIALVLPLELVVRQQVAEPYPALFQPAFGLGAYDEVGWVDTEVSVLTRTDQGEHEVPFGEILPATEVDVSSPISDALLANPELLEDPETSHWLYGLAAGLYPDDTVQSVELVWEQVSYIRAGGEEREVLYRAELEPGADG